MHVLHMESVGSHEVVAPTLEVVLLAAVLGVSAAVMLRAECLDFAIGSTGPRRDPLSAAQRIWQPPSDSHICTMAGILGQESSQPLKVCCLLMCPSKQPVL